MPSAASYCCFMLRRKQQGLQASVHNQGSLRQGHSPRKWDSSPPLTPSTRSTQHLKWASLAEVSSLFAEQFLHRDVWVLPLFTLLSGLVGVLWAVGSTSSDHSKGRWGCQEQVLKGVALPEYPCAGSVVQQVRILVRTHCSWSLPGRYHCDPLGQRV